MASALSWWLVLVLVLGCLLYLHWSDGQQRSRLPPGPRPIAFIGNLLDFPAPGDIEYRQWLQHKDRYGPISSVTALGQTTIIIHDQVAAHEVLTINASKTSGRPRLLFANKLCGYESITSCKDDTASLRLHQKLLGKGLGTPEAMANFRGILEREVHLQLARVLDKGGWLEQFRETVAGSILRIAYGYVIERNEPDPLVSLMEKSKSEFLESITSMSWAVDIFPVLSYLPTFAPGVTFKERARECRSTLHSTANMPYRWVRHRMAHSNHQSSYVSKLIQSELRPDTYDATEKEQAIMWTAAGLYGAGSDSILSNLTAFTLAMALHPEVQTRAQEEIDRVVGTLRLPTFADRANLPYINALVKEALRWWTTAPLGFPHVVDESFNYNHLHFPKGARIITNVWWFSHNPAVYTDPELFEPKRFLESWNEPDPSAWVFGYGRRLCPGRLYADASLYINVVLCLACFDIEKAVGEDGRRIFVDARPKPGVWSYPEDFKFQVKPRSAHHVALIREARLRHPAEPSDGPSLVGVSQEDGNYRMVISTHISRMTHNAQTTAANGAHTAGEPFRIKSSILEHVGFGAISSILRIRPIPAFL
ncbi:hypothetical protein S7711_01838 [Stachybotrys chartarum IBT 7711]|uniref:Cytochrome P450 n=1 Tax=Stachybotrys chartarum (strain CBS 109288 / IBT 7711) TaxID=1280523 RepID=A0A084AJ48_STACB|nr:hypothetical protein S7711_01838 [Stachybotrys chartarum IBT 7711]